MLYALLGQVKTTPFRRGFYLCFNIYYSAFLGAFFVSDTISDIAPNVLSAFVASKGINILFA